MSSIRKGFSFIIRSLPRKPPWNGAFFFWLGARDIEGLSVRFVCPKIELLVIV
jgi:hypothetical protein